MTGPGVCAKPTWANPGGRTGSRAGYLAHIRAGEQACPACTDAQRVGVMARYHRLRLDEAERRQAEAEAEAARQQRAAEREREQAEAEAALEQRRRERAAADNADWESRARARAAAAMFDGVA